MNATENKLIETLKSKRFWTSVVSALAAYQSYRTGLIQGPELASWLKATFGIYVGAVGLENVAMALRIAPTDMSWIKDVVNSYIAAAKPADPPKQ